MRIFRVLQIILITSFSLPAFAETDTACLRSSGDIIVALNSNIVTDDNGNLGASCKEHQISTVLNFINLHFVNPTLYYLLPMTFQAAVTW
tara:strand:+ start:1168 stop:1437 length:270 start_codon:yes stop_codon:yes gene_type:complete